MLRSSAFFLISADRKEYLWSETRMWGCYNPAVLSRHVCQEWSIILKAYCLLGCLIYFWAIILLSSEVGREVGEWLLYSRLLSHFNQTLQSLQNQLVTFHHPLGSPWRMVGKRKYWCTVVWCIFSSFGGNVKIFFISDLILNLDTDLAWDIISTIYLYSQSNTDCCLRKRRQQSKHETFYVLFCFSCHHI